jgi:hypothetical protein
VDNLEAGGSREGKPPRALSLGRGRKVSNGQETSDTEYFRNILTSDEVISNSSPQAL